MATYGCHRSMAHVRHRAMANSANGTDSSTRPTAKKLATTVYITEDQQALLKELNRRTRVPVAEFIREGIDLVLERHRAQLPGQLNLLDRKAPEV